MEKKEKHSTLSLRRTAILATTVALIGISLSADGAGTPSEVACVDDARIHKTFLTALVQLMKDKQTLTGKELTKQPTPSRHALTLQPASRRQLSAADIYRDLRSSVLVFGSLYTCSTCSKWHLNTASGFVLTDKGVAVTCYHVVKNATHAALGAMTMDGHVLPVIELLAADEQRDVALIRLKGTGSCRPLPLSLDDPPGTPVVVISHPTRRFYTMTEGIVSRYFLKQVDNKSCAYMEITADFAKGSSGAPVFNMQGNVVGIVASTQSIYYSKREGHQENLQMVVNNCIPSRAIRALTEQSEE